MNLEHYVKIKQWEYLKNKGAPISILFYGNKVFVKRPIFDMVSAKEWELYEKKINDMATSLISMIIKEGCGIDEPIKIKPLDYKRENFCKWGEYFFMFDLDDLLYISEGVVYSVCDTII